MIIAQNGKFTQILHLPGVNFTPLCQYSQFSQFPIFHLQLEYLSHLFILLKLFSVVSVTDKIKSNEHSGNPVLMLNDVLNC